MQRVFVRLVLLGLAVVTAWLLPSIARAAVVPICNAPEVGSFVLPQEPICMVVTVVDDETGETSVAPLCDPRGASAIAPPRLLAVSDARLDPSPRCGDDAATLGLSSDQGERAPRLPPSSSVELALLPQPMAIGLVTYRELTFVPEAAHGPRTGERLDVYKPPRA